MARPSDIKLAAALREAGLDRFAHRAERGEWNDFFGDHVVPKMALVSELCETGSPVAKKLAARVVNGEFDSGKPEADEWYATPDGQSMRSLMRSL